MALLALQRPAAIKWICLSVSALALLGAVFPDGTFPFWQFNLLKPTYDVDFGLDRARQFYAPVLDLVPPSGVVGILTDYERRGPAQPLWLMVVRYVLRPRAIVWVTEGQRPEWAVGVFKDDIDPVSFGQARGYKLAGRFEAGLVLFRRIGP